MYKKCKVGYKSFIGRLVHRCEVDATSIAVAHTLHGTTINFETKRHLQVLRNPSRVFRRKELQVSSWGE